MARFQITAIQENSRSILNYIVSPAPHDPFHLTTELLCSLRISNPLVVTDTCTFFLAFVAAVLLVDFTGAFEAVTPGFFS